MIDRWKTRETTPLSVTAPPLSGRRHDNTRVARWKPSGVDPEEGASILVERKRKLSLD